LSLALVELNWLWCCVLFCRTTRDGQLVLGDLCSTGYGVVANLGLKPVVESVTGQFVGTGGGGDGVVVHCARSSGCARNGTWVGIRVTVTLCANTGSLHMTVRVLSTRLQREKPAKQDRAMGGMDGEKRAVHSGAPVRLE